MPINSNFLSMLLIRYSSKEYIKLNYLIFIWSYFNYWIHFIFIICWILIKYQKLLDQLSFIYFNWIYWILVFIQTRICIKCFKDICAWSLILGWFIWLILSKIKYKLFFYVLICVWISKINLSLTFVFIG
jgi:hypothetical protein